MWGMVTFFDLHAQGFKRGEGVLEGLGDLVHHQLVEVAVDDAYLHAGDGAAQIFSVVGHRFAAELSGSLGSSPAMAREHQGAVLDGLGERAEVVGREAAGAGDPAETAHAAVGGLEAHGAAPGRGVPHRAGVVGADGRQAQVGGHRGRRAAAGSSRYPAGVPGIERGAEVGVHGGAAAGPLVHVVLAQDDRSGLPQARNHGGVEVGLPVRQDLASGGGGVALDRQVVLDGHRDAVERSAIVPVADLLLGPPRRRQGLVLHDGAVGVEHGVEALDPLQVAGDQLHRRDLPRGDARGHARDGEGCGIQLGHGTFLSLPARMASFDFAPLRLS